MVPIRKGDGTTVVPDGIGQVRTGDGRVLFEGDAIPDSVVDQWATPIDSLSDTDLVDPWPNAIEATRDMAGAGITYSTTAMGGTDAVSANGTDGHGSIPFTLAEFNPAQPFTWAWTVQGTDNGVYFGRQSPATTTGEHFRIGYELFDGAAGNPELFLRDNAGDIANITADATIDDGAPYSVVWVKPSNDPATWEVWVGDETTSPAEVTTTVERDQGFSDDFDELWDGDLAVFANNNDGSIESHMQADMGTVERANEAWSESDVQDFHDRQGWT